MASPTSRSLDECRKLGYLAQVVERWNQYSKTRLDLFGVIDVVACSEEIGILGIQACAGSSHSARKAKIMAEPKMLKWLISGGKIEVWSWSKKGARGKRKTWALRREPITPESIAALATRAA